MNKVMINKILGFSVILVLLILSFSYLCFGRNIVPHDSSRWQAVFLEDGQVYFGKVSDYNRNFVLLKDVYYLRYAGSLQQGERMGDKGSQLNLIKLGGEAHGPEGEMYVAKSKIVFVENLKDDSAVVQAINVK